MKKFRERRVQINFPQLDGLALKKLFRMVRFTIFVFFLSLMQVMAVDSYAQMTKLSLNVENESLEKVLGTIEDESEFFFLYNKDLIDVEQEVSVDVENETIKAILDRLLEGKDISYTVYDRQIVLSNIDVINEMVAQQNSISGTVKDENGEPLPGVSIVNKGTTIGTVSDIDGNFTLKNVPDDATLVFSFLGMVAQEISTVGKNILNVILISDSQGIDEVIVVGYGVQKKKLNTGATINVKGDELQKLNTNTAMEALQGMSPGLSIIQTTGQPGARTKVNIRGAGTIGDSNPLYVVDGVRVGNIDYLSPNDIESIDILKDAASAAIYGVNGANGVVLVTTKKGKTGKMNVTFDAYYGIQTIGKEVDFLNAQEYAMIQKEAYANSGEVYDFAANVPRWDEIENGTFTGADWFEEFTNDNAPEQSYSVSITGGSKQSTFSMGLSYLDQQGLLGKQIDAYLKRKNVRFNSNHVLFEKDGRDIISIGQTFTFTNTENPTISTGGFYGNTVYSMNIMHPWISPYDENGEFSKPISWSQSASNPLASMVVNYGNQDPSSNFIVASGTLNLKPINNLNIQSTYSVTTGWGSNRRYTPMHNLSDIAIANVDRVSQDMNSHSSYTWTNTASYDLKLGADHKLSAMIGSEVIESTQSLSLGISNINTIHQTYLNAYIDNASEVVEGQTAISGRDKKGSALLSFFGRVSYDFKEKYLFTTTVRRDASSNFSEENNAGVFPSVSAGWIMSKENFMSDVSVIDFLKLRASWGQNGNQNIGRFQYQTSITPGNEYFFGSKGSAPSEGLFPNIIPYKDISWETSEQFNLGFDAYLFDQRLSLAFDIYEKTTKDWLVRPTIVSDFGASPGFTNGGNITNSGFELALGWNDKAGDFKYSVNTSLGYNKNEVTKINNERGIIPGAQNTHKQIGGVSIYLAEEGFPIGHFWGYETDGIIQNQAQVDAYVNSEGNAVTIDDNIVVPGDVRFIDQNDDGIIDVEDKVDLGDPNPDYIIGLQLNLDYKGIYLSANAYGQLGAQVVKAYRSHGENRANYTTDWLGRWHGEGTSNELPRITSTGHANMMKFSDIYIHNSDFVRLSNLTVGYNLNEAFSKLPFQEARIYVTGKNLLVFTNYSGFDPEVGSSGDELGFGWGKGIDIGTYPKSRSIQLGVSVKF